MPLPWGLWVVNASRGHSDFVSDVSKVCVLGCWIPHALVSVCSVCIYFSKTRIRISPPASCSAVHTNLLLSAWGECGALKRLPLGTGVLRGWWHHHGTGSWSAVSTGGRWEGQSLSGPPCSPTHGQIFSTPPQALLYSRWTGRRRFREDRVRLPARASVSSYPTPTPRKRRASVSGRAPHVHTLWVACLVFCPLPGLQPGPQQ